MANAVHRIPKTKIKLKLLSNTTKLYFHNVVLMCVCVFVCEKGITSEGNLALLRKCNNNKSIMETNNEFPFINCGFSHPVSVYTNICVFVTARIQI